MKGLFQHPFEWGKWTDVKIDKESERKLKLMENEFHKKNKCKNEKKNIKFCFLLVETERRKTA